MIWDDNRLTWNAKFTALNLIYHKGDRGCFPKQVNIAKETGISIESVKKGIKELKHLLIIESDRFGRRSNDYFFLI